MLIELYLHSEFILILDQAVYRVVVQVYPVVSSTPSQQFSMKSVCDSLLSSLGCSVPHTEVHVETETVVNIKGRGRSKHPSVVQIFTCSSMGKQASLRQAFSPESLPLGEVKGAIPGGGGGGSEL